jgi:hypothetical protein
MAGSRRPGSRAAGRRAARRHHRKHRLINSHGRQQTLRPPSRVAALQCGDQIFWNARRAGSRRLRRNDGAALPVLGEITLTENHVEQLHRDLLQYSEKDAHHRGNYKTQPNNFVAFDEAGKQVGIVFETASPFDTLRRMSELIAWASDAYSSRRLHPLLVTAIFTVVLLEIHPFQDGNVD